ncbi:MAG TPA: hypothetical protein ENJ37_01430 [Deltaproteobacteria bacterium]|nr:hypothetical protein [Deltaproteobacteria bacterium]
MIEPMARIQIIGPRSLLDETVRTLHELSVLHIEEVPVEDDPMLSRIAVERDKLEEKDFLLAARERLKNLLFLLGEGGAEPEKAAAGDIRPMLDDLAPVEEEIRAVTAEKEKLLDELSSIKRYEKILRGFARIVTRLGGFARFELMGLTIDRARQDVLTLIDEEVVRITGGAYEMHLINIDETTLGVVLSFPKRYAETIRSVVLGEGISEIRLPDEYADLPLVAAIREMAVRKETIPRMIRKLDERSAELSRLWRGRVEGLLAAVEDAIDEIGMLSHCARTRSAFVMEGYVPRREYLRTASAMAERFGYKVLVRELDLDDVDEAHVPVLIKNPPLVRPFEVFLAALPTPRYGSVDPTPFFAVFFPVFFGIIVGDVGYGLAVLAIALFVRRRYGDSPFARDVGYVFIVSALWTILFGVLFGEFFGDLGERLGILHPLLFDRMRALKTFLVLSLGIGVGHVMLGIVLGFTNMVRRGRVREAAARFAALVFVLSILAAAAAVTGWLPPTVTTPALATLAVSVAAVTVLEGIEGPVQFIETVANIISYVRLMAVGTVSVVLAAVANKLGGLAGSLLLGVVIAVIIHGFNVCLTLLSPSIQSMRLHYVEFLGKFYEGGGRVYRPFKKR